MKKSKKDIILDTKNYVLKCLDGSSADLVTKYVLDNKEFHKLAMPDRDKKFFSKKFQEIILDEENALAFELKTIRFYIFKYDVDKILGDIVLSDIKRGNVSSATIGIKINKDHTQQGIAKECLTKTIQFAFYGLDIHRLEANILPTNLASINLFEKLGFYREGISRSYFKTGGQWRDHLRYSIIKSDNQ
jgi:ribosomal-protein-alanine N-acetyltransferase